jgi:hypothetical protein
VCRLYFFAVFKLEHKLHMSKLYAGISADRIADWVSEMWDRLLQQFDHCVSVRSVSVWFPTCYRPEFVRNLWYRAVC